MQGRHEHPTTTTGTATAVRMQEGDTFSCPNCGCEILLTRHGDPARMPNMDVFTCCCGTRMENRGAAR